MALLLPLLFAGVMGGWALLTLVGGERTRRMNEIQAAQAAAAKALAPPKEPVSAAKAPTVPVAPKPPPAKPASDKPLPGKVDAKAKPEAKGKAASGKKESKTKSGK